ncbi:MAG: alpha/beta hydrolase [Myxococcales bacterium]|nr:alpha/beta hydrolase [Myxococcales bacterium]
MKLLLLPGMDGTGRLFRRFVEVLPAHLMAVVASYDAQTRMSSDELLNQLPRLDEPHVIVGESFSGPLAVRCAAGNSNVRGVVLVASFVQPPRPFLSTLATLGTLLFRRPPPRLLVREVLLGGAVADALVDEVRDAIASVRPDVLTFRLRQLGVVDVRPELAQLNCPLLYLRARRDRLVPATCGARVVATGARRSLIDVDTGHLIVQSRPVESAQHVDDFIRTLA